MEIFNHGKHLNVPAPHFLTARQKEPAVELREKDDVNQLSEAIPRRLATSLNDSSDARMRLLADVQQRVNSGEYSTRAAFEKAAEMITGI